MADSYDTSSSYPFNFDHLLGNRSICLPRGLFNRKVDKKLIEEEKCLIQILPKYGNCLICFVYFTGLKRQYGSCINKSKINEFSTLPKESILNRAITAKPKKPIKTCTDCNKIYKIKQIT